MLPINIYAFTRTSNSQSKQKMERQLSKREVFLSIKEWELQGLRQLSDQLTMRADAFFDLCFYYSFQIPKLGKEFDLLRISEDTVINIELKSDHVSTEAIQKQLLQNQYYLAPLGRMVRSYTYISGSDTLFRLTNSGKLVLTDWDHLCLDLLKQSECFEGPIESLFAEENYLISPIMQPERFLKGEYFLTSQQRDIKKKIVKNILQKTSILQGFTGLPGTGKTLLLYDIAMRLSIRQRVCILHFGSVPMELDKLNSRLKRIDLFAMDSLLPFREDDSSMPQTSKLPDLNAYHAILIDEGHCMSKHYLSTFIQYSRSNGIPLVISYDALEAISPFERSSILPEELLSFPDYFEYRLTNRIRVNKELSTFIHKLMHPSRFTNKKIYPMVTVYYASNYEEACHLLYYLDNKGFTYIMDDMLPVPITLCSKTLIKDAISQEYDRLTMVLDNSFYYDEQMYLRSTLTVPGQSSPVLNLFHGLNRAKIDISLIILQNEPLFDSILSFLQAR